MCSMKKGTHQIYDVNKKEGKICESVVSSKSQKTSHVTKGENLHFVKIPFGDEKKSNSQATNDLDLFDICI